MKPCLLLIGGCPRSGTTALQQLLNSNDNVYISSEENLLKCLETLGMLLGTLGRRSKILDNKMRDLSARETLTLQNIHSHNFNNKAVWPTLEFIYKYHHKVLHPGSTMMVWGDKLPAYVKKIDAVLDLPNARYVHITRNPLDVVNSMLRRLNASRQGRDWWRAITDFSAMLDEWGEAFSSIMNVEDKSNVFHLHYEELVFNLDVTIESINKFLGVDLQYQHVLVTDPKHHFDRDYLTAEMIQHIIMHETVKEYVERYLNNSTFPNVASALRNL